MIFKSSRERLWEYFSTITYIDDQFDQCIVSSHEDVGDNGDIGGDPPLSPEEIGEQADPENDPQTYVSDEIDSAVPEKDLSAVNLCAILSALNQEKYKDIRFNPVLYNSEFDDEKSQEGLIEKIKRTPLTLIDWNLGTKQKAFDVITKLFDYTNQLKVIVVYTANYLDAKKELQSNEKLKESKLICEESDACCYRYQKQSLIVIARKQAYDITGILSLVSNVFIENCGLMPIMLLDYMAAAQNRSDALFGAFCRPFEDVYWLQMYFSERIDGEIHEAITSFFRNKFREECEVNPTIISELILYQKEKLKTLADKGPIELKGTFDSCLEKLKSRLGDNYTNICNAMKVNNETTIHACFVEAARDDYTWEQSMKAFGPLLLNAKQHMIDTQANDFFSEHFDKVIIPEELQEPLAAVKKAFKEEKKKKLEEDYSTFETELLPVLIQMILSTPDILSAGPELVKTIKYISNDNVPLENLLIKGKDYTAKKKEAFLFNKFHFGDLLVREEGEKRDYLLCITPPCDVMRPQKTGLIINFIRGTEIEEGELKKVNTKHKQNVHISAVPVLQEETGKDQIKFVRWQLYGIKSFALKDKSDYTELCSYMRPFTMSEQYTRQIANAMIAHFSRAGVDELFMKAARSLQAVFSR